MEFVHWIMIYNGVMSNLYGKDREDALAVIDDDEKFDRWMQQYERRTRMEAIERTSSGHKGKMRVPMSKDEYLSKFGNVVGG